MFTQNISSEYQHRWLSKHWGNNRTKQTKMEEWNYQLVVIPEICTPKWCEIG